MIGHSSSSSSDAVTGAADFGLEEFDLAGPAPGASRRLEVLVLDQDGADRTADQAAEDDAADRDRDRDGGRSGDARLLEERRKREAGRGTARQRDGAREHAEERVQPECDRHQHADDVLQDREHGRDQEETQHLRPADLEERQARAEADGREERDHERALQRRIERHERDALSARDQHRDRDEKPAEHRRRQVVAAENRDEAPEPVPEEERDAREGEGLYEV